MSDGNVKTLLREEYESVAGEGAPRARTVAAAMSRRHHDL